MRLFNILKRKICKAWLEDGPGDSVENAIIVHCSDYFAGIDAEYKYLVKKCGKQYYDWMFDMKILLKEDGRHYDLIRIKMEDGTNRSFYFDATEMLKCLLNGLDLEAFGIDLNSQSNEEKTVSVKTAT